MKVLLIVIDGASPRVVYPAIQTGRLSNLKRVADAGVMHAGAVTIFPSITPAATSSIVTGCYPAEHGIGGASWYDESRNEVVYYGDDFWVIARKGFGAFLRDFLLHLNGDRLKAPTVFELVERQGLTAGCVNYLVYRGNVSHRVNVPWLMALLPGVPLAETVKGPSLLCLGDFVTPRAVRGRKVDNRGGLLHRFGMDDASTAAILCDLVEARALADFTLAYFADNDYESHAVGPHAALPVVERVDVALGRVFDAAGGFERFVRDTCVIVTSDHGHCEVLEDREESIIALDEVLGDFRRGELGRAWRARDEIMICPNMRAAQIHLRQPGAVLLDRVTRALLTDARVDLVLKRQTLAHHGNDTYVVHSSRGRLEFWRRDDGRAQARDTFGTAWGWRGDAGALRLEMDGDRVDSTEYPNAFERIAGALDLANQGDIWVSARPGCEFEVPGGKGHAGGASHGALHALDSLSIAVAAGVHAAELPAVLRTIDIAPLCTALLGSPMRYAVGEPRRLTHAAR